MGALAKTGFDYGDIPVEARDEVKACAADISKRLSRTVEDIIEIGRDLAKVKGIVGHGSFGQWVEAEFGMSVPSASRFMNVAARFGAESFTVKDLPPSVLYALAAPSTDDAVVEEVVTRAAAGETFTAADVKRMRDRLDEICEDAESVISGTALDTDDYRAKLSSLPPNDQVHAAKRDRAFERSKERDAARKRSAKAAEPTRARPDYLPETRPEGFAEATQALGDVSRMAEFAEASPAERIIGALSNHERAGHLAHLRTCAEWIAEQVDMLAPDDAASEIERLRAALAEMTEQRDQLALEIAARDRGMV